MNARRDALAHRFIAFTLEETSAWPAEITTSLHELAFSTLPELVLDLDAPSACRFVRAWRERLDLELGSPTELTAEDRAWLAELARGWTPAAAEPVASGPEVSRLAELLRRFGPLALALPWRDDVTAKA
ncbi:MAG: hypothetical protein JWP01_1751 [Myxococcales bacterium]|nr:hypothetical protein [Myxococcales bacterium]